jgi:hypothetical protein
MIVARSGEWEYFTEGRHHLLLRFCGKDKTVIGNDFDHLLNHLIRVEKILPGLEYSGERTGSQRNQKDYLELVHSFIPSRYLLVMKEILITKQFLLEINDKISSQRPPHRTEPLNFAQSIAHLIPNLNTIHRPLFPPPQWTSQPTQHLSVEFKVKSGLLSMSPFLSWSDLKRRVTKFEYMQHVKHQQKSLSSRPLRHSASHLSQYNPSDLCSQDQNRIGSALHDLESNPQNNFIISLDGERVYGLQQTDLDHLAASCSRFLESEVPSPSATEWTGRDLLYQRISSILSTETALKQLQLVQCVDLLDAEGMVLVFQRLLALLPLTDPSDGSPRSAQLEERALERIANESHNSFPLEVCSLLGQHRRVLNDELIASLKEESHASRQHQIWSKQLELLSDSLTQDDPSVASHVLMQLYLLSLRIGVMFASSSSAVDLAVLEEQREQLCLNYLQSLSLDDCVLLLRLWLFALAACDASAILTLGRLSPSMREDHPRPPSSAQAQSDFCCGLIEGDTHPPPPLSYHLILVDLGPKPVEKLLEKAKSHRQTHLDAVSGWNSLHKNRPLDGVLHVKI